MKKIKDTAMITVVSGGIATIIQMLISWTLFLTGIIEQNPSMLHAKLLTDSTTPGLSMIILGMLANIIAGVTFAALIIYLLRITGTDYALMKGLLMGLVFSLLQFLFFTRLFKSPTDVLPNAISQWHTFIVYAIWGTIVAYIAKKYTDIKLI